MLNYEAAATRLTHNMSMIGPGDTVVILRGLIERVEKLQKEVADAKEQLAAKNKRAPAKKTVPED